MRTIPIIFLIATLTYSVLTAQNRTTAELQKQKQVLFDFRSARTSAPPRIPMATQKSVLAKVFRKYLTDEIKCNTQFDASSSTDRLRAARNANQIVPSIIDMATGSFTAPGQAQTAYVISVGECNASHAENFGTKRVAIFSGQQLLANVDVDFRSGIVRRTDINGDGLNELLMTSSDMNQGILVENAALLDFQNRRLRVIEDFGTVTEDSCASGIPGSSAKASVISISEVAPGKMPRLQIDNYRTICRKVKQWRFLSTGKMPD